MSVNFFGFLYLTIKLFGQLVAGKKIASSKSKINGFFKIARRFSKNAPPIG
jgi:hypothetical protein